MSNIKKNKDAGKTIVKWFAYALAGMVLGFVLGYLVGGIPGAFVGLMSSILPTFALMQMFMVAKDKNFLTLFVPLGENQKYIHYPDKFGKLHTIIVDIKHKGVAYKKGFGMIDDKGSEYSWGDDPVSFGDPTSGYTVSTKAAQYCGLLHREEKLNGYDDAIKTYLGKDEYTKFKEKFRKEPRPDIYNINDEIEYLLHIKPEKELQKIVFLETYDFKDFLLFLKYNYNPIRLDAAVETEKIWVKQEAMGYKDPQRAMNIAKAVAIVLFVLMIIIIVLSSVDLTGFLGMLGGK